MTNLRLTKELQAAYDPAVVDSVKDQVRMIDEGVELAAEARAKLAERKIEQAKGSAKACGFSSAADSQRTR